MEETPFDVKCDPHLLGIEDSLEIAAKNWNKTTNAAIKTGYREGMEDGSKSVFQEGFDKGYEEAFNTAFILGKFKSLINDRSQNIEHPADIKEILDKTRRGSCYVCTVQSDNRNADVEQTFTEIVNKQRTYSAEIIRKLYQYFQSVIDQRNVDMSDAIKIINPVPESSDP